MGLTKWKKTRENKEWGKTGKIEKIILPFLVIQSV